jgi:hypothetical protein
VAAPVADIAPDMKVFGKMFGMDFVPHHIRDADRKAKVERNFSFAEGNFLAGRTFSDWHDLNTQARKWCGDVANHKPKRSLGMSPDEAYLIEKAYLTPLPVYIPPVYQAAARIVAEGDPIQERKESGISAEAGQNPVGLDHGDLSL